MKPDRSNYEIWIIDWLDGRLSAPDEKLLMDFLAENPGISEEAGFLKSAGSAQSDGSKGKWDRLIHKPEDLPSSQVEYLSVAHLENDLTPEQESELFQCIEADEENRKIFELTQRTKLIAPPVEYNHKSRLRKVTPAARIIRYTAAALSAAAAILFLVMNHFFIPERTSEVTIAAVSKTDTLIIKLTDRLSEPKAPVPAFISIPAPVIAAIAKPDTTGTIIREAGPSPILIASAPEIETPRDRIPLMLAMSQINYNSPVYQDIEDDRGVIGKFFARTFRSSILKEKHGSDAPIQTYEFAQAGIDGLNKLLGWQMALEKTSDSLGNVKSVYFSSRVLKFNAPLKKITELQ
jgi:hypothetical protein